MRFQKINKNPSPPPFLFSLSFWLVWPKIRNDQLFFHKNNRLIPILDHFKVAGFQPTYHSPTKASSPSLFIDSSQSLLHLGKNLYLIFPIPLFLFFFSFSSFAVFLFLYVLNLGVNLCLD